MKNLQELMKAANKAIRLKDTEVGDDRLRELGFSEEEIKKLRTPDFCNRFGYASYELTNNNANIHRIEGRIKSLKAAKERGTSEQEFKTFKAVENTGGYALPDYLRRKAGGRCPHPAEIQWFQVGSVAGSMAASDYRKR